MNKLLILQTMKTKGRIFHNSLYGFYICCSNTKESSWYLHKDGDFGKATLQADSKYAYWSTEKEAQDFYNEWEEKQNE